MEYKYTGIILRKRNIGETDRIYDIYTAEQGKISAIARGVRKPQAKLAGHLENFCLVDLTVMRNKGLGNISGSIVENGFENLRQNFDSLEKVFETMKVFGKLVNSEEKDLRIFSLLMEYLISIDENSGTEKEFIVKRELVSSGFVFKLLELLGYKIETGKCVKCNGKLSSSKNFFDYGLGGIVCAQCVPQSNTVMSIGNNSIKIIRIFFQNNLKDLVKLKVSDKEINELKRVLQSFIKWTLE